MMAKTTNASDKFMLRLPDGARDSIKKAADEHGRTMNAEIIHLIERGQASANNQITPRDLFAASVLNALLSMGSMPDKNDVDWSFLMADKMMNERNKGRV